MLTSIIAFASGLAAKIVKAEPDPRDAEIVALKAQIDDLERHRKNLIADLEISRSDVFRMSADRNRWRAVAENTLQVAEADHTRRYRELLANIPARQGFEAFCNCVPGRQQLLATSRGEGS